MGHYDPLLVPAVVAEPFIWPALPEVNGEGLPSSVLHHGPAQSFDFLLGDKDLIITGPSSQAVQGTGVSATLMFGDTELVAIAPSNTLEVLLAAHGISDDWQSYGEKTSSMVLEHLLADVLEPLEETFGSPFRVAAVTASQGVPSTGSVSIEVTIEDEPTGVVTICAADDVVAELSEQLAGPKPPEEPIDVDEIPFSVRLIGPSFTLTAAEFAAATVGDAFLLEMDWGAQTLATFVIADCVIAPVRWSDEGFSLLKDVANIQTEPEREGETMSVDADTDQENDIQLPVTITMELGSTQINLEDMYDLSPGSVLPFLSELPTEMDLLANGKSFGRGELVRFDGKIAVRLTKIG